MNEELIDDLKQFITAAVTQATADLATKADLNGLRGEVSDLRTEMNQRFDDLGLKIDAIADAHAETLDDHEHRLKRLEQRAA